METVEVVVRIPKNRYETLVELNERIKNKESICKLGMYENAIANGILLPKNHGKLIDADALIDTLGCSDKDIYCKDTIKEDAPTIIEKELKDLIVNFIKEKDEELDKEFKEL